MVNTEQMFFSASRSGKPTNDIDGIEGFITIPLFPSGIVSIGFGVERAKEVDLTVPMVNDLSKVGHFSFFLFL